MNPKFFAVPLTLLIGACASTPASRLTPEDAVKQRAAERWELIIAGKASDAWNYLSPGSRELMTRDAFLMDILRRPLRYVGVAANDAECSESVCEVTIELDIEVRMPMAGGVRSKAFHQEQWVASGGEWYYVPKSLR